MRSLMTRWTRRGLTGVGVCLASALLAGQTSSYDLVLRGGWIVDGSGNPGYRADLAITGDTIARIAPRIDADGARVLDVAGRVVAPGFIDLHTHARRGIFDVPTADNYVRQGVTTLMEGPDGSSVLPVKSFLDQVAATGTSVNVGTYVGQGSIRQAVLGEVDRRPTASELQEMRDLVRQAMREGAFGLSTGLFYVPGTFSSTEEVIELARVAGGLGGIYTSHMRDEAAGVLDSVRETIRIGEEAGLPAQITHHKIVGQGNWGRSVETLKLVDAARARGVDVTVDQYPYTAASTGIQALLPPWALEGGREEVVKRLADPATRAKIKTDVVWRITYDRGGGDPKNVVVAQCDWDPSLNGRSVAEITRDRGHEPTIPNGAETVLWIVEQGGASGIFHAMDEADLERILRHPTTMVASDGEVPIFDQASPHPRSYGTFARILGRYVREQRVLTLADAVRKMSSLPAQRIGLTDRGVLRPGLKADIAVFDPETVGDRATFEAPHQYAVGFSEVIVNGQIVFAQDAMTSARPGRVLYGPAAVN